MILFTRYPEPGNTKTRLIPALGSVGAAEVQQQMTEHVVARLRPLLARPNLNFKIRYAGGSGFQMRRWLGGGLAYAPQGGGSLGDRLTRAVQEEFSRGVKRVIVVGADCPSLDDHLVARAFAALDQSKLVFGPACDGGYYLVGLSEPLTRIFDGIDWGTRSVLSQSLSVARNLCVSPQLLPELSDVDEPVDLPVWQAARQLSRKVSVIIPVLNDPLELSRTLEHVMYDAPAEVFVVDGGNCSATKAIAQAQGAEYRQCAPGRGLQMNAGARASSSECLLFLHADTWPPRGFVPMIGEMLHQPGVVAGGFSFKLRKHFPGRTLVEGLTNLRSRVLGRPYGDQGIFVRKSTFQEVGGFPEWPLLEDVEITRRLRRLGKIITVEAPALTSSRRWQSRGLLKTFALNQSILLAYAAGISPAQLAGWYRGNSRVKT
ncbi:MAG: TIGR04283 family arsenosugar biosynthesis glycosyltransferase [Verrucomicrobiota bacterium]